MPELRATARVQLHREFDLDAAAAQVPYYARLGVSHLYLSPIGTARRGSMHGYDVIDPTQINPELGGEPAFLRLASALRAHRMGAIMDIVPNHMAADVANPWWYDVLANGRHARHAGYFDIDWDAPGADGRVWLPVLEQPLDTMVARGALRLEISASDAVVELACASQRLPLSCAGLAYLLRTTGFAPQRLTTRDRTLACCAEMLRGPSADQLGAVVEQVNAEPSRMHELLTLQHYRPVWWRRGNAVLNYRRFFDISALVALSVERREVFDAVHALPLRLIAQGLVDGLRVDHVDGLSRPDVYLRELRRAVEAASPSATTIHVEKILAHGEPLRGWPIDGSTGYDFMDQVGALLHDPAGADVLRAAWAALSGRPADFGDEEDEGRRGVLAGSLVTEFNACLRAWVDLLQPTDDTALDPARLGGALRELLLQMRVYRTYLGSGDAAPEDAAVLSRAFDAAEQCGDPAYREAREALRHGLMDSQPNAPPTALRLARRRFEQLAAPLNAKAVEDTGFYRYGVLLSRNDVGSDPRWFAMTPAAFHQEARQRGQRWPRALLASATHDHKRGEDTRARLAVISERPDVFVAQARRWLAELARIDAQPSAGDRWMLLQTMLAAWPLELYASRRDETTRAALDDFAERIGAWQRKAIREAGLRTSWITPDDAYESACQRLVDVVLRSDDAAILRHEIAAAAHCLDVPGALNGLAATTLKLTVPGVPDIYQGTERWDQSLVDPDNRRPVDYASRQQFSAAHANTIDPAALLRDFRDGRIKQWLIERLLGLRKQQPALFSHGSYEPLPATGDEGEHAVAFMRREGAAKLMVIVPRLCAGRLDAADLPQVPAREWADIAITTPVRDASCTWRDVFTGVPLRSERNRLPLSRLLDRFPVAVLVASPIDD